MRGAFIHEVGAPPAKASLLGERAQRHHAGQERFTVNRVRIAIGRQLQRVESQRSRPLRSVTRAAIAHRRNAVLPAGRDVGDTRQSVIRRQGGVRAFVVPVVARKHPAVARRTPDHARLDPFAVEVELLPEPRSHRKVPRVRIGRVDRGPRRQIHPALLGGAVGPQRVLRRERPHVWCDDAWPPRCIQPCPAQPLRQAGRRWPRHRP